MSNKYQRLWRSNSWAPNDTEKRRKYRDVEMSNTENVCQQKRNQIELDNYTVNFKRFLQINKSNRVKQKPVKWISSDDIRYSKEEQLFLWRKSFDEENKCG